MITKKIEFRTFLPALIFSLCILELSFGLSVQFHTVWWFYFYFIWASISIFAKEKVAFPKSDINYKLLLLYLLSCSIYVTHHFLGSQLYEHSTSESFNILWWSTFGALLVIQIKKKLVRFDLFTTYVRNIVFFGTITSATLGLIKYRNILSGNLLSSYFYEDKLLFGSSLSTDYNVYSFGLCFGVLLSINLFARKASKKYIVILYAIAISVIVLSTLLSGSRRGVLMTGFVLFCLAYANRIMKARKQMALVFTIFLPVILMLLISNFWDNISDFLIATDLLDRSIARVLTLKEELGGENERSIRFIWSLDYFSQREGLEQIFGSGFEYLSEMGKKFSGEQEDNPHNYLFSALLYGGIIGFISMLLLTFSLISAAFKNNRIWYPVVLLLLFFGLTSSNSLFAIRVFPIIVFLMVLNFPSNIHKSNLANNLTSRLPKNAILN